MLSFLRRVLRRDLPFFLTQAMNIEYFPSSTLQPWPGSKLSVALLTQKPKSLCDPCGLKASCPGQHLKSICKPLHDLHALKSSCLHPDFYCTHMPSAVNHYSSIRIVEGGLLLIQLMTSSDLVKSEKHSAFWCTIQ